MPTIQDSSGSTCWPSVDELDFDIDGHARRLASHRWHSSGKRLMDCAVAAVLLILFSPLFVFAALAVKLSSAGPVFFRQEREGWGETRFEMFKFRSMQMETVVGANGRPAALATPGRFVKMRSDPRVTVVGRWLRKTSIDELPQLWNVLQGNMSLVGPRPVIPSLPGLFPAYRRARALVRPGITGLWQLRNRGNGANAINMLSHDLEYIKCFGPKQDLIILLRTIPAVLTCKGAF
ncbi:MAG: sugar transferase [Verrucomicrobiota bacterium]|jgi:lipopolysaccharide/colanic/teichoic acid biosynthesis glycosyltransferase